MRCFIQLLISVKPNAKTRCRGELAAAEVLARELAKADVIGILLFKDNDALANRYIIRAPDRVIMMSTAMFLSGLENVSVIENADKILERAVPVGGAEIKKQHIHTTPGAEERELDWFADFQP